MMLSRNRKHSEATLRATERRQREDAATRLHTSVPELLTLDFNIEVRSAVGTSAESRYVRRFVVERAPALFELPCADAACTDGGHDLTWEVMRSLNAKQRDFKGENTCNGNVRTITCGRVLGYAAKATYRD